MCLAECTGIRAGNAYIPERATMSLRVLGLTMAERLKHDIPGNDCFIAPDRFNISNATVEQSPGTQVLDVFRCRYFHSHFPSFSYRKMEGGEEKKIDSLRFQLRHIIFGKRPATCRDICENSILQRPRAFHFSTFLILTRLQRSKVLLSSALLVARPLRFLCLVSRRRIR